MGQEETLTVFGFGEGPEGNLSLPTVAASALTPMQHV
jgi:hypothetical protein